MGLKIFQVDAFSNQLFKGNPAAVVPLEQWLEESLMQSIAAENNLAETAFFVQNEYGSFDLRWFTPTQEVPLCGHATLASAYILFNELGYQEEEICFQSQSGELRVSRSGETLQLNFPSLSYKEVKPPVELLRGLSIPPTRVLIVEDDPNYFAVYDDAQQVVDVVPELDSLASLHPYGVVVTAPAESDSPHDCISRYFLPSFGIPEDPVTGSIHCVITPYWATQLGTDKVYAYQASPRGGELHCELDGGRVLLKGECSLFMKGEIFLP